MKRRIPRKSIPLESTFALGQNTRDISYAVKIDLGQDRLLTWKAQLFRSELYPHRESCDDRVGVTVERL